MDPTTLQKITYGMYIVASSFEGKINGQISNTVFQVTSEPARISVCINKQNLTHELIEKSKIFTVSILSTEAPMTFIGKFGFKSGRDTDKFKGIEYRMTGTGNPVILDHAIGFIDAKVVGSCDSGTHTLFIGEVVDSETFNDKEPMTYDYYHKHLKGKSPKTAPTYIKEN